ncbi:MAG: hypothetical protein NVS3B17_15810 [Vulcanimicrobiaceae bacterium]
MRVCVAFVAFVAAALVVRVAACASAAKVDVRADGIAFYPSANAALLAASGHVVVRTEHVVLRADAARYDLDRARIVASGHVEVRRADDAVGDVFACTAYAYDLATGRGVALRTAPLATFAVDAHLQPDDGAALPDAFGTVDLAGRRPYVRSRHAVVAPGASVRLTPASFPTVVGTTLLLPTFFYTLARNANLAQTAGPGASLDQPYQLFGSPNALTSAHLRYDGRGVALGLDTRVVDGTRAYAVASVVPWRDRRIDVLAFQELRPGVQQTVAATHAFGTFGFDVASYRLRATNRVATATLGTSLANASGSVELALGTLARDVGHYFSYQLHGGVGYDRRRGDDSFAGAMRRFVGGYVATPSATVLRTEIAARYDYDLTAYDVPHLSTNGVLTLTAARELARGVQTYASVSLAQADERYRDDSGSAAFEGRSTSRTYLVQTTFRGRGDDLVALTIAHTRDYPQVGGFGRPPLTASLDVTKRIAPSLRLAIGRSYAFGWGGRYLSPQFTFGVSP